MSHYIGSSRIHLIYQPKEWMDPISQAPILQTVQPATTLQTRHLLSLLHKEDESKTQIKIPNLYFEFTSEPLNILSLNINFLSKTIMWK